VKLAVCVELLKLNGNGRSRSFVVVVPGIIVYIIFEWRKEKHVLMV